MEYFTTEEKVAVVKWVFSGNSLRQTRDLFSVMFENRPIPSVSTIGRIVKSFETTGCVNLTHKKHEPNEENFVPVNQDSEILVLAAVEVNPNTSVRRIAE